MSLWRGRVRGDGSRIEAAHLLLRHVPSSHRGAHRGLGGISARCGEMDRCGRIAGALSFVGPLEPRLLPGLRQFAWRRRRRSRRRLACRRLRPAEQPGTEAQLSQQPVGAAGLVAGARCCRRASGIGVSHARQRPFELALLPSRKPRSLFMWSDSDRGSSLAGRTGPNNAVRSVNHPAREAWSFRTRRVGTAMFLRGAGIIDLMSFLHARLVFQSNL